MLRSATANDLAAVTRLALLLWPENEPAALREEFRALLGSPDAFVALWLENGAPVGFAQCQLRRDYVEGTQSSPVGYLEGIFVEEAFRGRGAARMHRIRQRLRTGQHCKPCLSPKGGFCRSRAHYLFLQKARIKKQPGRGGRGCAQKRPAEG